VNESNRKIRQTTWQTKGKFKINKNGIHYDQSYGRPNAALTKYLGIQISSVAMEEVKKKEQNKKGGIHAANTPTNPRTKHQINLHRQVSRQ